jgi:hypothetical protein
MRVIDGMHRLRSAESRGETHIAVRFFDGDDESAFLHGVAENVRHGLPLSLAERKAAADRIIRAYPHWSDRAVARAAGISDKTVGALRRRAGDDLPQLRARMGRDGRVRPISGAAGRQFVGELLASRPGASLQEIADAAGVSPATVQDVRQRLRRGEHPVTPHRRDDDCSTAAEPARRQRRHRERADSVAVLSALQRLKQDPSIRHKETGRTLLRWLDRHLITDEGFMDLAELVPPHVLTVVGTLARQSANAWMALAQQIDQRSEELR